MKKLISLLCLTPALLLAQESAPAAAPASLYTGYHRHDGFYLSMNIGPALGGAILSSGGDDLTLRGPSALIDFKIGAAVQENLILSFDVISRTISGPELEYQGMTATADDDFTISDPSIGIGLTKYFMPHNVFVSGTLGMGQYIMDDDESNTKYESEWGFALHAKVGKEWGVGKDWGLGVSGGYGLLVTKDKEDESGGDPTDITTHQFYLLFNTTFN